MQMWQQRMLDHLARARTRLAQQPCRPAQRCHAQRLAARLLGQRVLRRCHDDQFVAQPGLDLQPLPVAAALDQAHVDLHGQHGFAHFLGVGDLQVHAHQRMRACQPRQHFGQRIGADGGAGRHAQAHRHIGRTRGKRLLYASCLLQHAQGLRQ